MDEVAITMDFELNLNKRGVPEEELIADLIRVRDFLAEEGATITKESYTEIGQFTGTTIKDRFGSWNAGLAAAGIKTVNHKNISETDLFENLRQVWTVLGRQPRKNETKKPLSKYSYATYNSRFGSWNNALQRFVEYINSDEGELNSDNDSAATTEVPKPAPAKKRTSRHISDRMRFRILSRDGFTCQSCGESPIKERGVELHVDHITPWSKGGETVPENLQAKCKTCNLGKGNAFTV